MKITPSIARAMKEAGLDPDKLRTPRGKAPDAPVVKRNKYGAKPTQYKGVRYSSKAEANRAEMLDWQIRNSKVHWWIGQPKFRLGVPENVYIADFLVVTDEGVRVEDVKGVMTGKFKRDLKLWKSYGPCDLWIVTGKKIEVVQGRDKSPHAD